MSTDATAVVVAATPPDTVEKPPRRFPPPCWTQDETLALIDAYRERWYALRRGYLRTADWDAVAVSVSTRCPGASPAKTSAQCRHKMEKLRQRYRAEKQRALSYPYPAGRYFSTWFFFENMEAMENGTTPPTNIQNPDGSGDGSGLKSLLDQNILKLKLKASNNADLSPDQGFDNGVKAKRSKSEMDMEGFEQDEADLIDLGRRKAMNGIPKSNLRSKPKNSGKMFNNFDVSSAFNQSMLPPGSSGKKIGKFDSIIDSNTNVPQFSEEFWVKVSNNNHNNYNTSAAPGYRAMYQSSLNPRLDPRATNEGSKRGRNGVEEIVESIKMLGEGFVRMERAKMEMAREMEEMRMEMEMKRNEMLLQSQKQIVDAFMKGLIEMKTMNKNNKKKMKTDYIAAPDSSHK